MEGVIIEWIKLSLTFIRQSTSSSMKRSKYTLHHRLEILIF